MAKFRVVGLIAHLWHLYLLVPLRACSFCLLCPWFACIHGLPASSFAWHPSCLFVFPVPTPTGTQLAATFESSPQKDEKVPSIELGLSVSQAPPAPHEFEYENLYQEKYAGRLVITIDLKEAGFQVFRSLSPEWKVHNEVTYYELAKTETKNELIARNKHVRVWLLGQKELRHDLQKKRLLHWMEALKTHLLATLPKSKHCREYETIFITSLDEVAIVWSKTSEPRSVQRIAELREGCLQALRCLPVDVGLPATPYYSVDALVLLSVPLDNKVLTEFIDIVTTPGQPFVRYMIDVTTSSVTATAVKFKQAVYIHVPAIYRAVYTKPGDENEFAVRVSSPRLLPEGPLLTTLRQVVALN